MLKLLVLITFIIIALTVDPYLIPQVDSSPASSSPSANDNDNDNDNNDDSGPQDDSSQDDSTGTDSSSDESGDDGNDDDSGIRQADDQDLVGDDGNQGVDKEPPTSTERQLQQVGDPIPDVDVTLCPKVQYYD